MPEPQILGSTGEDLTTDWTNIGGNVLAPLSLPRLKYQRTTSGSELVGQSGVFLVPQPQLEFLHKLPYYLSSIAKATGQYDTSPAS